MATEKDIRPLLEKISAGNYTEAEEAAVKQWLHQLNNDRANNLTDDEVAQARESMWASIQQTKKPATKVTPLWPRIAVAASLLLVLSAAVYLLNRQAAHVKNGVQQSAALSIPPGGNKAYLVLANGQRISLSDAKVGTTFNQGGQQIKKTAEGVLVYNARSSTTNTELFNTIETPRGGQYRVILPDGSSVWLNASSSLRYDVNIGKTERSVALQGEAYFEVAHNAAKPFKVRAGTQTVEVLGTHFNMNTYHDEPRAVTTLLQGKVRVYEGRQHQTLKPGQLAAIAANRIAVERADTLQVMGWRHGDFVFHDRPIKEALRQISRWYDVKVSYEGTAGETRFGGSISRSKNLQDVLNALEATGLVRFVVNGRHIMVKAQL